MATITDFSQFTDLRALASRDEQAALRDVAEQFESLFVHSMLKSMREASFGDPIFGDSGGAGMFRDMFDQQISADIASGPGLGLADLLVRQMGGDAGAGKSPGATGAGGLPLHDTPRVATPAIPVTGTQAAQRRAAPGGDTQAGAISEAVMPSATVGAAAAPVKRAGLPAPWSDARRFVADILPFAREAAARLDVSPLAVLSQAALETGWGKHVMPADDGNNSLNLFGIKARGDWQGAMTHKKTVEFENGLMTQRREPFRVYDSLRDTFSDYVQFLRDSPRYQDVVAQREDVGAFADALQGAGYATDPNYASKLRRIAGGETMRDVLASLKESDLLSLSLHVR